MILKTPLPQPYTWIGYNVGKFFPFPPHPIYQGFISQLFGIPHTWRSLILLVHQFFTSGKSGVIPGYNLAARRGDSKLPHARLYAQGVGAVHGWYLNPGGLGRLRSMNNPHSSFSSLVTTDLDSINNISPSVSRINNVSSSLTTVYFNIPTAGQPPKPG